MYFHKSFGFAGTFCKLSFFFVPNYALLSKPDSCEQEPPCELIPDHAPDLDDLKIGEFRNVTVCACRPRNESGIQVAKGFYANDKKGRYFNNKGKVVSLVKR